MNEYIRSHLQALLNKMSGAADNLPDLAVETWKYLRIRYLFHVEEEEKKKGAQTKKVPISAVGGYVTGTETIKPAQRVYAAAAQVGQGTQASQVQAASAAADPKNQKTEQQVKGARRFSMTAGRRRSRGRGQGK
jgi:hypothetical protein